MKPVIFGCAGLALNDDERDFFRDSEPAGYILFGRNIEDREQLRALTDEMRVISGRENVPILIDQEGGRVSRMKPPVWPEFPAGEAFNRLYEKAPISALEAARVNYQALALTLIECGITVNCAPLLDVRQDDTVEAIGDRAFGHDPDRVAALGRECLDGMAEAGVKGVVKHMPGHGRAKVDSHHELPRVTADAEELAIDIAPFRKLSHAGMGMTAHIVYKAWDPDLPATMSPKVIEEIIRGDIGFDGLLYSDDLDMKALKGDRAQLAADVVAAGCDIALNCWARMDEMVATAKLLPDIAEKSRERLDRAMEGVSVDAQPDALESLIAKRDELLSFA